MLDGVSGVREVHRDQEPLFDKSSVEVADENVGDDSHKNDEDFLIYFQFSTSLHPIVPGSANGKQ